MGLQVHKDHLGDAGVYAVLPSAIFTDFQCQHRPQHTLDCFALFLALSLCRDEDIFLMTNSALPLEFYHVYP